MSSAISGIPAAWGAVRGVEDLAHDLEWGDLGVTLTPEERDRLLRAIARVQEAVQRACHAAWQADPGRKPWEDCMVVKNGRCVHIPVALRE